MPFAITLSDDPISGEDPEAFGYYGTIVTGDEADAFLSLGTFWNPDHYRAQWRCALKRLCEGGEIACLLTSVSDPATADVAFGRALYREGQVVFIRDVILMYDQLLEPLDLDFPERALEPRRVPIDAGEQPSEWRTTVEDILIFLDSEESAEPWRSISKPWEANGE